MGSLREAKELVGARDGWTCWYCGQQLIRPPKGRNHTAAERPVIATLDHWVPPRWGGTDDLANFVLACRPCNEAKGMLTGPEYLVVLAYRRRAYRHLPPPTASGCRRLTYAPNEVRPRRCRAEAPKVTSAQLHEGNQSNGDGT